MTGDDLDRLLRMVAVVVVVVVVVVAAAVVAAVVFGGVLLLVQTLLFLLVLLHDIGAYAFLASMGGGRGAQLLLRPRLPDTMFLVGP